jgi:hypothetical protein
MNNQNEKIANIKVSISDNCSEGQKSILLSYWKLKSLGFVNTPKWIKTEFQLAQPKLTKLVTSFSSITFFLYCENCNTYERNLTNSQSNFNKYVIKCEGRFSKPYSCNHCMDLKNKKLVLEQEKKSKELIEKFSAAIENKNWKFLSIFEKRLLGHCIEMNFSQLQKYYGDKLGQAQFYKLIRALENIEKQDLLLIQRNSKNNYISSYQYVNDLIAHKDEIIFIEKVKEENTVEINKENNTIKIKLTVNKQQYHPDSPMFSGVIKFNERIVIEPDVDYIFGQWQRANDNMYLTLTPLEDLDKLPTQRRISDLPVPIQKGITDFLNNLGKKMKE